MFKFLIIFAVIVCSIAANDRSRILKGSNAKPADFPQIVSLQFQGRHHCGATILNEKFVLTAAHCTKYSNKNPFSPMDLTIQAGSVMLYKGGVVHQVKRYEVHEDHKTGVNDLALLELAKPLVFNDNVRPIKIGRTVVPYKTKVTIVGWGQTGNDAPVSPILQSATVVALSEEICGKRAMLGLPEVICLEHPANEGACKGDSGGPAIVGDELVGVASFVASQCGSRRPDAYARVSNFLDWIESRINK